MPNDRVQLRPPRRLTAASALLCLKPQNPLSGKEFHIGACIIDAYSVSLRLFPCYFPLAARTSAPSDSAGQNNHKPPAPLCVRSILPAPCASAAAVPRSGAL